MRYSLVRESDGAGDSGPLSMIISSDGVKSAMNTKPEIGYCIRVGSLYARTFQNQDYWTTTEVTEILEETEDTMKFKTRSGSTYTWQQF